MIAGQHLCFRGLAKECDKSGDSLQSTRLSARQNCSLFFSSKVESGCYMAEPDIAR
jgi:hypothetical protein